MELPREPAVNPLLNFTRQPKIYIKLPSNGQYWPPGSLVKSDSGEYPVFSMTAKDELLLKIPDALMNGQAVVDVIQNCIPNIKDAWKTPNIDIDFILIAIRLATYGEMMTTPLNVKGLDLNYQVDLRLVLDRLSNEISWDPVVPINNSLTIFVKPLTYKDITKTAMQTFETQKILDLVNDNSLDEKEKISTFQKSFKKLTDATISMVNDSVFKIDTIEGSTENQEFIQEFLNNADSNIVNKVRNHLEKMKEQNSIKPLVIKVTDEMRENGIFDDEIEIPLVFDPSTFFA